MGSGSRTTAPRLIPSWLSGGTPPEKGLDAFHVCGRLSALVVRVRTRQQRHAGPEGPHPVSLGCRDDAVHGPGPSPPGPARSWWVFPLNDGRVPSERRTRPFRLTAFPLFSFLATVPINIKVNDTWDVENPPADWKRSVKRWVFTDTFRSTAAALSFLFFSSLPQC